MCSQVFDEAGHGGADAASLLERCVVLAVGLGVGLDVGLDIGLDIDVRRRGEVGAHDDPGEHLRQRVEAPAPSAVVQAEEAADTPEVTRDGEIGHVVAAGAPIDVAQTPLAVFQIETPTDAPDEVAQVVETHECLGALQILGGQAEEVGLQSPVDGGQDVAEGLALGDAQRLDDRSAEGGAVGAPVGRQPGGVWSGSVGRQPGGVWSGSVGRQPGGVWSGSVGRQPGGVWTSRSPKSGLSP